MKISCPQCGADFLLEKPDVFIKCEFCKNSLFIDIDEITAVYTFEPAIESNQLSLYLKKDFEKIGFNENIELINSAPVYFPFWQVENEKKLESGSYRFPLEKIESMSTLKNFFDSTEIDFRIEVIDIDTQPKSTMKRTLYYCPFFVVEVEYKKKRYRFFVNAVNGNVYGDPIPFFSAKDVNKLFPLFLTIFMVFLAVNYFFNRLIIIIAVNVVAFFIFFQISYSVIEKRFYKK